MRTTQKTVLLVALLGLSLAAPSLKNRLGQVNAKNLAQWGGDGNGDGGVGGPGGDFESCLGDYDLTLPALPEVDCPCAFTPPEGIVGGAQSGASGVQTGYSEQELREALPDTSFAQYCQSNCCECSESAHAAIACKAKNRTFEISGSISVLERVRFAEEEVAAEAQRARAEKESYCILANDNGVGGGMPNCTIKKICYGEDDGTVGGGNGNSAGIAG